MSSSKFTEQLHVAFQRNIAAAVEKGQVPKRNAGPGPKPSLVTAQMIANAHDAILAEHFGPTSMSNPAKSVAANRQRAAPDQPDQVAANRAGTTWSTA
jgi:hypothetical protein